MLNFLQVLTPFQLSLIIALGILIFLVTVSAFTENRKLKSRAVSATVRSSAAYGDKPTANPVYIQGLYIFDCNMIYGVGGQGQPPSGMYTVLSGQGNTAKITVLVNGEKLDVNCAEKLELLSGDTICPVSHSMVLR